MSTILGIWHLALEGGQEKAFRTPAGVQITNVSFGEEIVDWNGRSVVNLTFKSLSSSDDEDDEGDDDDDEGDELGLQDATTVLCALTPGKIEQAQVNLTLGSDEDFQLRVSGKNTVYLTGQYIDQHFQDEEPFDSELDSDEEDAYDLRDVSSDVEMHPDDLDNVESDGDRFEEVEDSKEEFVKPAKRARESDIAGEDKAGKAEKKKKLKAENGKAILVEAPSDQQKNEKKEKKSQKNDKKGGDVVKEQKGEEKPKKGSKLPKKTIAGGILIQDHSIGTGPMAKKGDTLKLRYVGKLTNGKEFDKNTHGKPFTFHLGKGEVIKGWDEGIVGMQVGGERILTIPANMGYGSHGQEGIPPNSTLIFEVKLLQIK